MHFLTNIFNMILVIKKFPEEWRKSKLVQIIKNNGDLLNLSNFRERKTDEQHNEDFMKDKWKRD